MDKRFAGNSKAVLPGSSTPEYSSEEIFELPSLIAMTALIVAIGGTLSCRVPFLARKLQAGEIQQASRPCSLPPLEGFRVAKARRRRPEAREAKGIDRA